MDFPGKGRQVIEIEMEALRGIASRLDASFEKAGLLLLEAVQGRSKIIVTGVGKSGHIGAKIAATLTSTGAPSVVLDTVNAVHGDLGMVSDGDVLIALSYSGETEELVRLLPFLKRLSVRIIALTGHPASTLGREAAVCLDVSVSKEACPLNLAPTSSTTAMLAMGDALAMVLLEARGFQKEDFARFHPGGTLGKNLLLKIQDVMRPLETVACLPESATVNDALRLWSEKRVGAALVTAPGGTLAGIYTHGDFVRGYQKNPAIGQAALKEVMTSNPVSVLVDKLAVEVLNIFQQHRIDDLVVVDHHRKPVGLVDAQDIAKLKLI
jgi:arabinose-5-phosphate isomerase